MAGLIQGPCEVLPTAKFIEESERRSQAGPDANMGLQPVFVCKYVSSLLSLHEIASVLLTFPFKRRVEKIFPVHGYVCVHHMET